MYPLTPRSALLETVAKRSRPTRMASSVVLPEETNESVWWNGSSTLSPLQSRSSSPWTLEGASTSSTSLFINRGGVSPMNVAISIRESPATAVFQ
jgi:hypothetical protein